MEEALELSSDRILNDNNVVYAVCAFYVVDLVLIIVHKKRNDECCCSLDPWL